MPCPSSSSLSGQLPSLAELKRLSSYKRKSRHFLSSGRFVEFWSGRSVRAHITHPTHSGSVPPSGKQLDREELKGVVGAGISSTREGWLQVCAETSDILMRAKDSRETRPSFRLLPAAPCVTSCGFEKEKWHQVHLLNLSAPCPQPQPSWGPQPPGPPSQPLPWPPGLVWPQKDLPKSYWTPSLRAKFKPCTLLFRGSSGSGPYIRLHAPWVTPSHFPTLHTEFLVSLMREEEGKLSR